MFQKTDLLKKLKIKDIEDGEKIFDFIIDFLIYMPAGDVLVTSSADFVKIDDQFINIISKTKETSIIDSLSVSRIIKIV